MTESHYSKIFPSAVAISVIHIYTLKNDAPRRTVPVLMSVTIGHEAPSTLKPMTQIIARFSASCMASDQCLFICVSFFGAQQSSIQFGITLEFVNDERVFMFG